MAAHVGEQLDRGGGDQRRCPPAPTPRATRADRSDDQSEAAWKSRRLITSRIRTRHGDQRLLDVGAGDQMEDDGDRQQDHRHPPGPPLAAEDAPAQGHQGQPGHGDQRPGGHAGPQREELQHEVQPAPQWRGDGVEQVDDAGEEDGGRGPPPHPPGPPVGLAEVGGRRPRLAHRIGGHQRRDAGCARSRLRVTRRSRTLGDGSSLRASSIRTCSSAPVSSSTQLTRLMVEEDRGQAEPSAVLLHHLGGGPDVGVEPDAEVGELGLEGGRGDQAGIPPPDQAAGRRRGPCRWPRPPAGRSASAPPPRIDHIRRLSSPSTRASTASTTRATEAATTTWSPKSAWCAWRMARRRQPRTDVARAPRGSPPPAAGRRRRTARAATRRSGPVAGRGCGRPRTGTAPRGRSAG